MQVFLYAAAIVIGYLLGAMPIGYMVGKTRGVNVLQHGSGRTGGTNVMRAAGLGGSITDGAWRRH
jgi:glycerol-3-phosphate acyltransferase PlsY